MDNNIEIKLREHLYSCNKSDCCSCGAYVIEVGIEHGRDYLCMRCSKPEELGDDLQNKENTNLLFEYCDWDWNEKLILRLLLGPIAEHATRKFIDEFKKAVRELPTLKPIPYGTDLSTWPGSSEEYPKYYNFTENITYEDFNLTISQSLPAAV